MAASRIVLMEPDVKGASGKEKVNGVELYFERYGNGSHALLCIPGALAGANFFVPQMNYFGRSGSGYTVIGYDPRGRGRSTPHSHAYPSPFYYEIDAKDAVGLMEALGFKVFSLLGWSDGGTCAIITAARYQEVIKNLVVWGPHTYVEERDFEVFGKLRTIDNWNPTIRTMMEAFYGKELARVYNEWLNGYARVYNDPLRCGDICKKEVREVQCPTLVVHGDEDAIVSFSQIEFLERNFQNCRCEIIHGGKHTLHWKHSDSFNKLVDEFSIHHPNLNVIIRFFIIIIMQTCTLAEL